MGEMRPRRVGVVGLGRMGLPMSARLAAGGLDVACTDVLEAKRAAVARTGARWRPRARDVAAGAEVVVTILPGAVEVASVVDELAGAMAPGSVWIDMSTASPAVARLIASAADPRGVRTLDAPVGGDPVAAGEGRLLTFVGGSGEDLDAVRDVLGMLADRIIHVGPAGSGYTVKLLANSLWFGQAVAVAETLTLARRAGLDMDVVRAALGQSAAASRFLAEDVTALLEGDDLTSFALARCCEQLASVVALGDDLAVPMELTAVVSDLHRRALARYGDVDGELLGARFVAERAGVSFGPRRGTGS